MRGAGNAEQSAAMLRLIGYLPDDVYLTTGPLYHSGPGGFMAIAHALGNTVVVQKKVRRRGLAAPGRDAPRDDDVLGADADAH